MAKVEALQYHTAFGKEYQVGDTYEIDDQYVETLRLQGKAVLVDRKQVAQDAAKQAEQQQADQQRQRDEQEERQGQERRAAARPAEKPVDRSKK